MAIAHVGSATSKTANTQVNTSLAVTLGSTTAGDLNVVEITAKIDGTGVNATFTTPSGWTKLGEAFDSGTTSSTTTAIFYRFFVGGDGSTVTVSWSNAGQAVAGSSGYSGVDTTTPIPTSSIGAKASTDTSYSATMTTSVTGWVRSGFANRSGHTYSAAADTVRCSDLNTSATSIYSQDSAGDVSSGTITRTATGSGSTSIGSEFIYLLNPASAGGVAYTLSVTEGLSLGEDLTSSTLLTAETTTDVLGLTDTTVRTLNPSSPGAGRVADYTFQVEMAAGSTPNTAAPTYSDITARLTLADTATLQRGRENESSTDAQPGRASFTVNNAGGAFTPGDTGSAFAPMQLRRPIRWTATVDGRNYPLWQGFLDSVGTHRDGLTPRAVLSCSDRIARLGKATLGRLADAALATDSVEVWPLRSLGEGYTVTDCKVPGGSFAIGGDNSPDGEGDPTAELRRASTTSGKLITGPPMMRDISGTWTNWTLEIVVNPSLIGRMAAIQLRNGNTDSLVGATLGISLGGVAYFESPGGTYSLVGSTAIPADRWTHLAVVASGTTSTLYVNGVAEATQTGTSVSVPLNYYIVAGGCDDYTAFTNWAPFDGYLAFAGFVISALSAARIADHAGAVLGYAGERTTDRFARAMDSAGVPSSMYAVTSTSPLTVAAQPFNGRPVLDAINELAALDGGFVYADSEGIVQYAAASSRYDATVGLVLDAAKAGQVLSDIELETDDALLVNDATYTAADGSVSQVTDTTSIDAHDAHVVTATLPAESSATAYPAASWLVYTRAWPTARSNRIDVNVAAFAKSGGNVANLLSADIGTRMQVTNLPDDLAPGNTLDLFVEGITHHISANSWVVSLTTSPVGYYGQVFTIDSATLGLIDGTSVIAL